MPYTNPWSNVIPADSDAANDIGAQIRQLRLDIEERMETVLGGDPGNWTDDPVTIESGGVSKSQYIHASIGSQADNVLSNELTMDITGAGRYVYVKTASALIFGYWYIPVILPVGVTLTKVYARIYRASAGTTAVNGTFINVSDASETVIGTLGAGAANDTWQTVDSGALTHTITTLPYLFVFGIKATSTNTDARLQSVRVDYLPANYNFTL